MPVARYDLVKGVSGIEQDARERKARKHYLDLAAKGDASAKLLLKTHWRLRGVGDDN